MTVGDYGLMYIDTKVNDDVGTEASITALRAHATACESVYDEYRPGGQSR